jgi:hypothetical protein
MRAILFLLSCAAAGEGMDFGALPLRGTCSYLFYLCHGYLLLCLLIIAASRLTFTPPLAYISPPLSPAAGAAGCWRSGRDMFATSTARCFFLLRRDSIHVRERCGTADARRRTTRAAINRAHRADGVTYHAVFVVGRRFDGFDESFAA